MFRWLSKRRSFLPATGAARVTRLDLGGMVYQILAELHLYLVRKNSPPAYPLSRDAGRRIISSGVYPDWKEGGELGPGERWAIINNRPTRVKVR